VIHTPFCNQYRRCFAPSFDGVKLAL